MKKSFLFIALILSSEFSSSAELVCSGTVQSLSYHANNSFMISLSSMNAPVFFCSPESVWAAPGTTYITGPETCKMLYSTFLAAKMSGKSIDSVYFDGSQVPASCNTFQSWQNVNIRHFVLQ